LARQRGKVPQGRQNLAWASRRKSRFFRPSGAWLLYDVYPALKRWAMVCRPPGWGRERMNK
jgi:hypothetical protein